MSTALQGHLSLVRNDEISSVLKLKKNLEMMKLI